MLRSAKSFATGSSGSSHIDHRELARRQGGRSSQQSNMGRKQKAGDLYAVKRTSLPTCFDVWILSHKVIEECSLVPGLFKSELLVPLDLLQLMLR